MFMDPVFQNVLVATDGSPLGDKAVALALRLGRGARVTALLVAQDYGLPEYLRAALCHRPDAQALRDDILAERHHALDEALARVADADVLTDRRVVLSDRAPCHEIVALAQREGCDLIVMATHGYGGRLAGVLGSQAQAVLSLSPVPVLVAR